MRHFSPPTLAFLHTAESHVARFEALTAELAPGLALIHRVRPDLLAMARETPPDPGLATALAATIEELTAAGATFVVCTCSTLGPLAEVQSANVMRIDRPMAEQAVAQGGPILLAACLESTLEPSLALIRSIDGGAGIDVDLLCLPALWPLFEAGDQVGFTAALVAAIRPRAVNYASVILAQASMADAAAAIPNALASPLSGLHAALTKIGWQPRPL